MRMREFYLSCYLSPPGAASIFVHRHDQSVALWEATDDAIRLMRLWELERLSGQKHHYWPIFSQDKLKLLIEDLLSEFGLALSDVRKIWGLSGFSQSELLSPPAGAEKFPIHSLSHLFGGLLLDTSIFKTETIIGLAADGTPDLFWPGNPRYWYAGCASVRGKMTFVPIQSPAPLYGAATRIFRREPGTLMALAYACPTNVQLEIERRVERLNLYGGRKSPYSTAIPFLTEVASEVRTALAEQELSKDFPLEEHVQSATMKIVQQVCDEISIANVKKICRKTGVDPEKAYLSTSGGYALNCPTNSLLMHAFGFKGLQSPPCANNSGQAFGIGLLGIYNEGLLNGRSFSLNCPFYGSQLEGVDNALAGC